MQFKEPSPLQRADEYAYYVRLFVYSNQNHITAYFNDIRELNDYLKQNAELAAVVGYPGSEAPPVKPTHAPITVTARRPQGITDFNCYTVAELGKYLRNNPDIAARLHYPIK